VSVRAAGDELVAGGVGATVLVLPRRDAMA
jgi:hypothetical protein